MTGAVLLVAVPAGAGALAACRLPDPGCRLGALPCAAQTPRAHVAWDEPQVRICNRDLHDNIAALTDDERVAALVQAAKLSAVAARVGDEPLEPMAACCPAAKANGCVSRARSPAVACDSRSSRSRCADLIAASVTGCSPAPASAGADPTVACARCSTPSSCFSVRTVETHRAHIQQKLGRSTRAELVRYALDNRLLDR